MIEFQLPDKSSETYHHHNLNSKDRKIECPENTIKSLGNPHATKPTVACATNRNNKAPGDAQCASKSTIQIATTASAATNNSTISATSTTNSSSPRMIHT